MSTDSPGEHWDFAQFLADKYPKMTSAEIIRCLDLAHVRNPIHLDLRHWKPYPAFKERVRELRKLYYKVLGEACAIAWAERDEAREREQGDVR
ncbi:MAG: hypothetical protein HZY73_11215 [Micropruina sp.]|nr:MAG: hypothetical protein HZY73_11215 [Micropruina sp.]